VTSESREIVAVPSPEELAYAGLLVDIETRKRRLAALDAERTTLESALSHFAVAVKARIGGLKDEIRQTRLQLEEIRRRMIRLRNDPDADPIEVEREVAEELYARAEEARAEEEATRFEDVGNAPPARPPRREAAIEAEILRVYRELAKRYHPDLAQNPEERRQRAETMLKINVAYRERDLVALQKLLLEAERARPAVPRRLHRQKLSWAHREIARLDRAIIELEAKLGLMRRSDTYVLWRSPDQSDAILDDLEAKTKDRLTRERGRLDEATTGYQRLLTRRRRAQLLRERTANLRTDRVPVGTPSGSSSRRS
jgi:tetratricopeptide (TPR) repeat protein